MYADKVADIPNINQLAVSNTIDLLSQQTVFTTSFHISGTLAACVQTLNKTATLRLISIADNGELASATCGTQTLFILIDSWTNIYKRSYCFRPSNRSYVSHFGQAISWHFFHCPLQNSAFQIRYPFPEPSKGVQYWRPSNPSGRWSQWPLLNILWKLVLVGKRRESNCCVLSVIDVETGVGTTQLYPDFADLAFISLRSLLFGITTERLGSDEETQRSRKHNYEVWNGQERVRWADRGWVGVGGMEAGDLYSS